MLTIFIGEQNQKRNKATRKPQTAQAKKSLHFQNGFSQQKKIM